MAMIPDSVRPYWDFVAKYHFWLLAPLVPALILPTLFMAAVVVAGGSAFAGWLPACRAGRADPAQTLRAPSGCASRWVRVCPCEPGLGPSTRQRGRYRTTGL